MAAFESTPVNTTSYSQVNPSDHSSVWIIIKNGIGEMIMQALGHATDQLSNKKLNSIKNRILTLLSSSLAQVQASNVNQRNHSVHNDINAAVTQAVDGALTEFNFTEMEGNQTVAFRNSIISKLDYEIDMNVLNQLLNNSTDLSSSRHGFSDFFHNLPLKDETMFVALICMGVIVPVIFITLFLIFFYKRRKENRERSQEMLLREQPELTMDDCSRGEKSNKDDIPDLQLRNAPV